MQRLQVGVHPFALAFQKAFHRIGKSGVRQPVGAAGLHRQQSPRHFVFALGAAFKAVHAMLNAPLQRLVVAGLKVQAVHAFQRPPIAPIGDDFSVFLACSACGTSADSYQTASNGLAIALGNEQHPGFGHGARHVREEGAAQVGWVAVFEVGAFVAAVEEIPVARADVLALQAAKSHACIGHTASLLFDLLALFLGQAGQKVVKAGEAIWHRQPFRRCFARHNRCYRRHVLPVELHGVAQHQALVGAGGNVFFCRKQQVQ